MQWKHLTNTHVDPATGRGGNRPLRLPNVASSLESSYTAAGQMYYDTDNSRVRIYINGTWTTIASGAATAYDDIGAPDANASIAFAGYTNTWTSTLDTGSVFTISNTDAALSGQTNILDLKFTDDGEANGIFLRCLDNSGADAKFTVGADGATTIAGVAAGTAALTLTAGDITVTSGAINIAADSQNLTLGASGATDSYIQFDGSDLIFYDSTLGGTRTLSQLAGGGLVSPTISGNMVITDGTLTWTDASDEQAGTFTFNGTSVTDIGVTSATTSGTCLSITADSITTGSIFYAESSTSGMTTGNFYEAYNGSATVFEVGLYGAVTIAGNAATDVLTVTAGDIQLTAGDIDIDLGRITVDNTADEGNTIKRNNATGTAPVLEVEQTHATGGVSFLVDQNATGDVNALEVTNAGTGFSVTSTGGAAGSEGFEFICGTSGTGIGLLLDGTTATNGWVGAASTGYLQITSDGTLAQTTASLVRLAFSGTSASGGAGTCLRIEDTSTSGGGTEYAAYISSTNSEALHVDAGTVQFDEAVTLGVNDTGADLQCFGATAGKYIIWDESADQLQLTDATEIVLGGTPGAEDGLSMQFDGTSSILFDAITANDQLIIGSATNTDLLWHGTSGVALTCDSSGDSLTVSATAILTCTGTGTGDGLVIPSHATNSPSDTTTASLFFEIDANKLWVYNGVGWVSTTLA